MFAYNEQTGEFTSKSPMFKPIMRRLDKATGHADVFCDGETTIVVMSMWMQSGRVSMCATVAHCDAHIESKTFTDTGVDIPSIRDYNLRTHASLKVVLERLNEWVVSQFAEPSYLQLG